MQHIITGLSVQKRNPQRVNIYLDGDFAFGLSRILAAWLSVGQSLTDERISELQAEDQYESAYQRSLHFLNYRPRTQAEIRRKLSEHEIPGDVIERILQRLMELNLLDDERFAKSWIENRNEFRPRSRRALAIELKQHGIAAETIEQSLEAVDEENLAYQAALKQAHKYQGLDWLRFRQKMYGFLARRGFNYEVSAPITARVWADLQSDNKNNAQEEVDL